MFNALSPRNRLWVATGLVLGLAAMGWLGRMPVSQAARWGLGALALAGVGMGWWCRRSLGPRFVLPERLRIVSRAGLSQRCGLALVEVDGKRFLVAFGDSFAELHETPLEQRGQGPSRDKLSRRRSSTVPKGVLQ
ncbi:flagellar biosynthetic protein FliO [Stigmatella sp. ncwal1]|uniref:Flagellar biosynthetic protein FliO n=1 Tax=Stigmatella ashevillensis TaxID=2995309 RepID=A0ABT5D7M0_9BACT|nr:flagellar biosynthetic protein FliO [Stigmatella ashevillena]MDC0709662.1 flagellar biosynthetic protein FliO [Stigmatella ashevillena]